MGFFLFWHICVCAFMYMHLGVHVCVCCVLSFVVFLMLISGLTVVEWIFGFSFAVTPTCQAVVQVNGAWCLVLRPLCVEV